MRPMNIRRAYADLSVILTLSSALTQTLIYVNYMQVEKSFKMVLHCSHWYQPKVRRRHMRLSIYFMHIAITLILNVVKCRGRMTSDGAL